jgi:hypothetical protein
MAAGRALDCAAVDDLAPLFVLDALDEADARAITAHLATCPRSHDELRGLAGTGIALALSVEPVPAPRELREQVLRAVARTPQVPDTIMGAPSPGATVKIGEAEPVAPVIRPELSEERPSSRPASVRRPWLFGSQRSAWLGAAAAVVAVVLVAVVVVGVLRGDDRSERVALLTAAVEAAARGDAFIAPMTGVEAAADAAGFAVLPTDEPGYIVISGLPAIPSDKAYQAWYIADGAPSSAGLLTLWPDGIGTITGLDPVVGTSVVALTVEDRPGADAPSGEPVVLGELPVPVA